MRARSAASRARSLGATRNSPVEMSIQASAKASAPVGTAALAGDGRQIIVAAWRTSSASSVSVPGVTSGRHRGARPPWSRVSWRPPGPDLLADGDAMAERDQLLQVLVGGMDGHAAHGDVVAEMLAALGQRDAERARGDLGIGEEHLVEIVHAIEEQAIWIGRPDLQVLRHHRRGGRKLGGRRGGSFGGGGAGIHGWKLADSRPAIRRRRG